MKVQTQKRTVLVPADNFNVVFVDNLLALQVAVTETDGNVWVWCQNGDDGSRGAQIPCGEVVAALDALVKRKLRKMTLRRRRQAPRGPAA